ncbi:MAG: hypothetical protein FWD14_08395, partial [Treponema sp.]|nr:hypothetical protein [Treponema sp.]
WCIFLKYRHEHGMEPLIKELCFREEGIMRADKEVKKHDRSWLKYMRNVSREKDRIDERYRNIAAYKRGCEEAAAEKTLVIARKLLAEGSTPEFIQKITGLSYEEINKL